MIKSEEKTNEEKEEDTIIIGREEFVKDI